MTRDQKTYRLAYWMACVIIAATFLSGYYKLLYPADFALAIRRFNLLPEFMVNIAALYIPWLETVCATCLLFIPRYRVAALLVGLALLVLFSSGIAITLLRGLTVSCGCFSNSVDHPMTWLSVARNIGLTLLAALALVARRRSTQ